MIDIIFPDGTKKKYKKGVKPIEIAYDISPSLSRNALSSSLNNNVVELNSILNKGGEFKVYTWKDDEGKKAFWHSSAHVLAQSIKHIYPQAKLTIGPAIDNGFYYDVDFGDVKITEEDLIKLETQFKIFTQENNVFSMRKISKKHAIDFYNKEDNQYKVELINDLEDENITFCDHSNFSDLCKGGHIPSTGFIKAVKLLNIAGAYWRGNENNKQLTRIYGISFPKQKELEEYLNLIEESKKRDHRKLGKELELFSFSEKVGQGLPMWLPKGTILKQNLESFLRKLQKKEGYQEVITPHIGIKNLYETSGHYEKYGSDSFRPIETPGTGETFLLKPMNCPHHCEIFNNRKWSYKDLPVRYSEFGTVYRYEQSGELQGLKRVRGFTVDDAHIFCRPDQLLTEFNRVIDLVLHVFKNLSFDKFEIQVSFRDLENKSKYIGSEKNWNLAEDAIIKSVESKKLNYKIEYGEAAFYGPKLDFMIKDSLNRNWQLGTIQVDYNLPQRFNLLYKGNDNKFYNPVMIHRAPFGSLERLVAILIEHTAGNFPLWLSPEHFIILPVNEKCENYSEKVLNKLENYDIRGLIDNRNETISKKIRDAEINKYPFMLIVGDKELKEGTVSVRKKYSGNIGVFSIKSLIDRISDEISKSMYKFEN